MSIAFENSRNHINTNDIELEAPKGWFTAEELEQTVSSPAERPEETKLYIKEHLPMAAKRAERLIAALQNRLGIEVPESYLRVRHDGVFQILLLVKQADYISPKIAAARILAEEFTRTNSYDICFTFSVQSESVLSTAMANGYKLKHVTEYYNPGTRLTH